MLLGLVQSQCSIVQENPTKMIRLWAHEVMRVFHDRLVDDEDRQWLMQQLRSCITEQWGGLDELGFEIVEPVASPTPQSSTTDPSNDAPVEESVLFLQNLTFDTAHTAFVMDEVIDHKVHSELIERHLADYNSTNPPITMVLFDYAIQHVCRLSRVLRIPRGNLMLVGVGGSGRQTCCRLAAHMSRCQIFQIEMTKNYGVEEWRADIKLLLRKCGVPGARTVFLLTDSQLRNDNQFQDISQLLLNSYLPNLFDSAEEEEIIQQQRSVLKLNSSALSKDLSNSELMDAFAAQCRCNLHLCLSMSPIGWWTCEGADDLLH